MGAEKMPRNTVIKQERKIFNGLLSLLGLSLALTSGCAGLLDGAKPPQQLAIQITPSSLSFGNVRIGKKVSQSLSVKNTGTTPVNITSASLSSAQFTLSGITFPFSLISGSTANLTVSFSGSVAGAANGTLKLKNDAGDFSAPVALTSMAAPSRPQLSANPSSVSFGSVTTGTKGSSPVTLNNSGGSDLVISAITLNGASFGISGLTTPLTISAGQSATLMATYAPTSSGNESASISITSSDPASPATINLSGTGTATPVGKLTLNPASLSFGNVTVGKNSILSSTVTNSGQATVHISAVSTPGSGFTASGLAAGAVIAAGQSASIQVHFAPTTAGPANSGISIASDASGSLAPLSLSGMGVASGPTPPTVSIASPTSGSSVSGPVTVTASASAAAGVSSVQFKLDGANLGPSVTSAPYSFSWDTTKTSNGNHSLSAVVTDSSSNQATSTAVSITVSNSQGTRPTATITSPAAGTAVSGTITVAATASASSGIQSVQFLIDGSNLGPAITQLPYSQSWNTTNSADGPHTLSAIAISTDTLQPPGSASVTVTVQNGSTTPPTPTLSSTPGWHKIPGTTLSGGPENASPCPSKGFRGYDPQPGGLLNGFAGRCYDIIGDPSAAAIDTKRNRMLLWGGGHNDYGGNEVYSLEINQIGHTPTSATTFGPLVRLTNPGPPNLTNTPVETLPPATILPNLNFGPTGPFLNPSRPTPNARHLYDAWFYVPTLDAAVQIGGALNVTGAASNHTWTLAMNSVDLSCSPDCDPGWQDTATTYNGPGTGTMAHWDPNTNYIWMYASNIGNSLNVMSASNMTGWTNAGSGISGQGYHSDGVIDPQRDYFIHVGNNPPSDGIGYWPLAGYRLGGAPVPHITPTLDVSCLNMMSIWASLSNSTTVTTNYVGMAYDPIGRRIVIWPGTGNTLWYMNTGTWTWTCTSETFGSTKGVDYPQDTDTETDPGATGTFSRFGYFPAYDIFVLCNDPRNDCWYLRPSR